MSDGFAFSEAVNLAIHAMIDIYRMKGKEVQLKEIIERLNVSPAHLSKVMQMLRKAGLLEASRGPRGGYTLAVDPISISLKDIYTAIEGTLRFRACLFRIPICNNPSECRIGGFIRHINDEIAEFLSKTKLADIPLTSGRTESPAALSENDGKSHYRKKYTVRKTTDI